MSNTRRHVQAGWGPGNPQFDEWNARRPPAKQTKSVKHQTRDRRDGSVRASLKRSHRFTKGVKNTLHNLEEKVEQLRAKEAMAPENPQPSNIGGSS